MMAFSVFKVWRGGTDMEKLAEYVVRSLIRRNIIKEHREIYQYGFQVGVELTAWGFTCLVISFIWKMQWYCIYVLMIFFLLRSYTGGLHFKNYKMCYFFSCFTVMLILYLGRNINLPYWPMIFVNIILLFGIYNLSRANDKIMNEIVEERAFYLKKLKFNCVLLTIGTLMLSIFWNKFIYAYMLWTLLVIMLSAKIK